MADTPTAMANNKKIRNKIKKQYCCDICHVACTVDSQGVKWDTQQTSASQSAAKLKTPSHPDPIHHEPHTHKNNNKPAVLGFLNIRYRQAVVKFPVRCAIQNNESFRALHHQLQEIDNTHQCCFTTRDCSRDAELLIILQSPVALGLDITKWGF